MTKKLMKALQKKKAPESAVLSLRLLKADKEKLDQLCEKYTLNRAKFVIKAIQELIDKTEQGSRR